MTNKKAVRTSQEFGCREAGNAACAPPSLAGWLMRWLDTHAPARCTSRKTVERYKELAGYVVEPATPELAALASTGLRALRPDEIEAGLLSLLRAEGRGRSRNGLSVRTVRHVAGVLHVALEKAWRLGLVPENLMRKVEWPRLDSSRLTRALTAGELSRLRDVCREDAIFPFLELALATGCRRGELLALEWTDVDWRNKTLSVWKSLEETRSGVRVKCTKSRKPRVFALPDSALAALDALRKRRRQDRLVFPGEDGGYMLPHRISQLVVRRLRRARILDASLHTLRHTHATHLLSQGVPLRVVAERLGHSDPGFTARIYAHVLQADDRRAAEAWDRTLDKAA